MPYSVMLKVNCVWRLKITKKFLHSHNNSRSMERKIFLIVTAGGSGTRMGASLPKLFVELEGVPVLQRTIARFREAVPQLQIITVLPQDYISYWKRLCARNAFNVPQIIVEGGFTRFHSVRNALERVPDGAIVAVHDGVRPLLSVDGIRSLFAEMETSRAVIPVLPLTDTVKVLDKDGEGRLTESGEKADRSRLYGAQTPQIFCSEDLKAAYARGYDTSFTDDASVASAYGIPLSFVAGERYNIKLTTKEDLLLASFILHLSL